MDLAGAAPRPLCYDKGMNLDDAQRRKVTDWIEQGLKLSEIQTRLEKELELRMTYLDVRLLVDELKLMPKDPVSAPKPPEQPAKPAQEGSDLKIAPDPEPEPEPIPAVGGNVRVSVDQIARPGAVVSGKVTFSDGKTATWYLNEQGQLGLGTPEKGYRPPPGEIETFQLELQRELQKAGFC